MNVSDIRKPLYDALEAVIANRYQIESDNIEFQPPTDAGYIAVTFIYNEFTVGSLGDEGQNENDGIFQIDLNWPLNTGEYEQNGLMAEFYAEYRLGKRYILNNVDTEIISFKPVSGRKVDGMWRISASIGWRVWANR